MTVVDAVHLVHLVLAHAVVKHLVVVVQHYHHLNIKLGFTDCSQQNQFYLIIYHLIYMVIVKPIQLQTVNAHYIRLFQINDMEADTKLELKSDTVHVSMDCIYTL